MAKNLAPIFMERSYHFRSSCFLILGMLTTLLCIVVLLDLHSIDVYCCLVGLASSFTVLIRIRVSFDNLVR